MADEKHLVPHEERVDLSFLTHPVVLGITLVRLVSAVYILINPLGGVILSLVLDMFDATVIVQILNFSRWQYHVWDKNVDLFQYIAELVVGIGYGLYLPLFLLLFYRFFGHFMYGRTGKRAYLVWFPNFFEMVFLWLIIFHPTPGPIDLVNEPHWGWLAVFLLVKELQEIYLHYLVPTYLLPRYGQQMDDLIRKWWQAITPFTPPFTLRVF